MVPEQRTTKFINMCEISAQCFYEITELYAVKCTTIMHSEIMFRFDNTHVETAVGSFSLNVE